MHRGDVRRAIDANPRNIVRLVDEEAFMQRKPGLVKCSVDQIVC